MEIQLHGKLVTCTPEEYKRLIDLNLIEAPVRQILIHLAYAIIGVEAND